MTYTIELSARAEADAKETYNYIREHGPADPDDWKSGLDEKLASLNRFPDWCGFAAENDSARVEVRQLL